MHRTWMAEVAAGAVLLCVGAITARAQGTTQGTSGGRVVALWTSDASEVSGSADAVSANTPDASDAEQNAQATKGPAPSAKHKLGPFEISINWRTRIEGWDWFRGATGENGYAYGHSTLRAAIGQTGDRFDWEAEASQITMLDLPTDAVLPSPQGNLGQGGNAYAANGNERNVASIFLKQAFVEFKGLGKGKFGEGKIKGGRFEFFDGDEAKPRDPTVATLVRTRIEQRLLGNSNYSPVQRSFDGAEFSWDRSANNVTLFAARPTQGIYQANGMGELDIEAYYGAFNRIIEHGKETGAFRVFGVGYVDDRNAPKADNRSATARAADHAGIQIGTYGADYAGALNTATAGKFDLVLWGVVQTGQWGTLTQRSDAFVGEFGWQPPVRRFATWLSAGYSYGSGDGNPKDSVHGTFFQVLTTPRMYARFSFYNMMNNEDLYAIGTVHPTSKLVLQSQLHTLRLASAADDWYQGSGASQPAAATYTARPSDGRRSFANVWDLSADYPLTKYLSLTLYYANAWGKGVVQAIYPDHSDAQLGYLETNFRF